MNTWVFVIMCLVLMTIGTLSSLYARRIGRWLGSLGFHLFKIAPWLNFTGLTREEAEHQFYNEWPLRGYWLFWLWGVRILGAMMALFGDLILLAIIVKS